MTDATDHGPPRRSSDSSAPAASPTTGSPTRPPWPRCTVTKLSQPFSRREERVKELQHQLAALGLKPGLIDGRYGPITTDAVRRFQRAHDLPVDGVADPVTLNALKASVKGSPFIVRTERVKELQRQLQHLGLEPGMVDGRYGPLTTEAVKQFQEAHNLPADGIADPETLSQIKHNTPTTPERELSQTQE